MTDAPLLAKLSLLDRLLSLWIALAAGLGLALGQLHGVQDFIDSTTLGGGTNVLVAIGLIVMMYPPLAKVRWNIVHRVLTDWKLLLLTTFQNWVLGPFVMYLLAAAFFRDDPGYMAGLSLVGCARCIAMVVVWNALAGGDDEYCAAIVAINSLITIGLYSPYAAIFLNELPTQMSLQSYDVHVSLGEVAKNVGIYMGVPFVLGLATWFFVGRVWKGDAWYRTTFTPRIGVLTLIALLFTVVVLFATQSERITDNAGKVLYAAVPLLLYFLSMFLVSFALSTTLGATYPQSVALAFTAASNNFELALAVAIASFGLKSDPALMSVVGALIEIPTMLTLVYLAFWFRDHLTFKHSPMDLELQAALVESGDTQRGDGDERSAAKGEHKPTMKQNTNASDSDAVYVAVADA